MSIDTSGPSGTSDELEAPVTLKHDLAVVAYFSHVRPVFVEAHGPHQKHFAVLYEAGERTEDLLAPRGHAGPVAEEALRCVVALEHVSVPTLELAHHAVVELGCDHEAIFGSLGKLSALGCKEISR